MYIVMMIEKKIVLAIFWGLGANEMEAKGQGLRNTNIHSLKYFIICDRSNHLITKLLNMLV